MNSVIAQETEKTELDSLDQARRKKPPALPPEDLPTHVQDGSRQTRIDQELILPQDSSPLKKYLSGNYWRVLLYWMPLAFLLRLFIVWRFEQVISPDGIQYVNLGRNLIAGNFHDGLSTYWPPLYPMLVGFSSLFFRDAEFAGRFVSIVAGSLLVIPSYKLIRDWYGERAAFLGAGLIALHPLLIYYSTVLLTESTYTLLFTCGVLAGWSALSNALARSFLLAGVTFGACYLLKPEAAGFILLLLVPVLGRKLFDKAASFKTAARNALLLCAGFMLMAAPYLFYLRQQTGAWTLSGKFAGHLWQGTRQAVDGLAPTTAPLVPDMTTAFVQLTKALRSEYEIFNLIFPPTFVLLVGLGLFRKKWTRGRVRRELYLFSFIAATLAGYAITLPNIRFIMPLLPLLLCWLSKGVVEFSEWAVETFAKVNSTERFLPSIKKAVVPIIITGLLASLLPLAVYLWRGDKWSDYYGQKLAAMWIREHDASKLPVIMSTVPVAAFYAGGRHVEFIDEDYETLMTRARREGVAYLLVNERNFKFMRLRFLLDDSTAHPGLRLVHRIAEATGHRILVYAVDETLRSAPQQAEGT